MHSNALDDTKQTCDECGEPFTRKTRWQRFCCVGCRNAANARKRWPGHREPVVPVDPDIDILAVLGENVRLLRLRRRWSQEALALAARMHRNDLTRIECGKQNTGVRSVAKLAAALGVSPGSLLEPKP